MLYTKSQKNDMKKCGEMAEKNEYMECFGCSCNVCISEIPTKSKELKKILREVKEIQDSVKDLKLPKKTLSKLNNIEKELKRII